MDLMLYADVVCPYCGEEYQTTVDTSQEDYSTIEDCAVCCRPIELTISCEPGELHDVQAARG